MQDHDALGVDQHEDIGGGHEDLPIKKTTAPMISMVDRSSAVNDGRSRGPAQAEPSASGLRIVPAVN